MERKKGHLTNEERIRIETLLKEGYSENIVGQRLRRDRRSIEREVQRNSGPAGYRADEAQRSAMVRREKPRHKKFTSRVMQHVRRRLRQKHSPEQIAETMEANVGRKISFRRIYDFIADDKATGGILYKELRIANGQPRRPQKTAWRRWLQAYSESSRH